MKTALLVIDLQNGCFEHGPVGEERRGLVERVHQLMAAIRPLGPVVVIQHEDPLDGFGRGTEGWQFIAELKQAPTDLLIEKQACDSFLETGLEALLKAQQVERVVICGCATDFCLDTTLRSAASKGFQVWVAADAHACGDRPHLTARQVKEHHHFVWRELALPRGQRIQVLATEAILQRVHT